MNLFRLWHLLIVSDRLFRRLCPLYLAISSFSFKHKEHLLVLGLFAWCLGFYVVCISLFEFGFSNAIIYFVIVVVLIGCYSCFIHVAG